MKNAIYIGTDPHIELPKGGFLYIHDEVPITKDARYFDPRIHSFNPLKGIDYRKACDIVDVFEALFCVTNGTLTETTGLDCIAEALDRIPDSGKTIASLDGLIPEPDKKSSTGEVWAYGKLRRLMRSPILKRMLCSPTNFSFNPRSTIMARVNRAELSEFDALAVGLFLIAHFRGNIIVPDFGFYGRDTHTALIRENRLIAGVHSLDDLPDKLRRAVLTIEDKTITGALYDDAVELAKLRALTPQTVEFNEAVAAMMQRPEPVPQPELWKPDPLPQEPTHKPPRKRKRQGRTWHSEGDPYGSAGGIE